MKDLPLLLGIAIYFLSSLGGVSTVKFLNYRYCFTSWKILALLSRSTWILSAIFNSMLRHREGIDSSIGASFGCAISASGRQLCSYFVVAVGLSMVEIVNSFSMSVLPGSLYMLLKGSDVGWSMILSYFILKKEKCYSVRKVVAAALIMVGIGAVLVLDVINNNDNNNNIQSSQSKSSQAILSTAGISMSTATLICLGGALLNSLCSVGTEAVLKRTLQNEQDNQLLIIQTQQQQSMSSSSSVSAQQQSSPVLPSKLLLSNAYSMYTSFFSFVLLLPLCLISSFSGNNDPTAESRYLLSANNDNSTTTELCPDPFTIDVDDDDDGDDENNTNPSSDTTTLVQFYLHFHHRAIVLCLALLALSRFLERLCKHFICVHDSAVTFSMVQAARRWSGIYIVGAIFREKFRGGMIVGSLVSGVGFVLHGYDSHVSSSSSGVASVTTTTTTGKNEQRREYKQLALDPSSSCVNGSDVCALEEIELKGGPIVNQH